VTREVDSATYWDTSAILSALFEDVHSKSATSRARTDGLHLVTSLAWAEALAVMSRIERDGILTKSLVDSARSMLEAGPWRRTSAAPNWHVLRSLAQAWPLRGADLWHLATAKELQLEIPELELFSFGARLNVAARAEGLIGVASTDQPS
jgi:predicted nucleic acid-binding protein